MRAQGGTAQFVRCDVADPAQQATAFDAHARAYGGSLDVAFLNAGIMESGDICGTGGASGADAGSDLAYLRTEQVR